MLTMRLSKAEKKKKNSPRTEGELVRVRATNFNRGDLEGEQARS